MKLKAWYKEDGFLQFMLGNTWNAADSRAVGGRGTLLFCWSMMLICVASVAIMLT